MSVASMTQVPPHNREAELAALGSILLDCGAAAAVVGLLEPADFYSTAHQHLFQVIVALHRAGVEFDALTLAAECEGRGVMERLRGEVGGRVRQGREYLAGLAECVPTPAHAAHYSEIVRQRALDRRGQQIARELMAECQRGLSTNALASLRQDIESLSTAAGPTSSQPAEYIIDGDWSSRPWAIPHVIRCGQLGLIFGPPKSSKSNMTLALATSVVCGRDPIPGAWRCDPDWECGSVLVLSEMTEDDSNEMMRVLYDPQLAVAGRVRFLSQSMADAIRDVDGLITALRQRYEAQPYGLLLLDTLTHWFVMLEQGEDMNGLRVKVLLQRLKALGHELGIVVLVVAHTRKDVGEEVSFDDILGTGGGIRGATDVNISLQLLAPDDPTSTLMRMRMEARDPYHMRRLAEAATRRARGLEPEIVHGAPRSWFLRLDWDPGRAYLRYVKAEQDLIDQHLAEKPSGPKALRPRVVAAVRGALARLHEMETQAPRGKFGGDPVPVHVFSIENVAGKASAIWDGEGKPPGRTVVRQVLEGLVESDEAFHVDSFATAESKPPGYGRFGGYGLVEYEPEKEQ